jgi:uncharacterized membrane protein ArfB
MDFLIQWLSYLLAFLAGSAVAWVLVVVWVKRRDRAARSADSVYEVYPES